MPFRLRLAGQGGSTQLWLPVPLLLMAPTQRRPRPPILLQPHSRWGGCCAHSQPQRPPPSCIPTPLQRDLPHLCFGGPKTALPSMSHQEDSQDST